MYPFDYPYDTGCILTKWRRLRRELAARSDLLHCKIALLSGSTIGQLKNVLEVFLLSHGIAPEFHEGVYARYYEEGTFEIEQLRAFAPDILYVHTTVQNVRNLPNAADTIPQAEQKFTAECARWQQLWDSCQQLGCTIIQNNFEMPHVRLMGSLEAVDPRGHVRFVRRLNEFAAQYAAQHQGFLIHDIAYLAAELGIDRWFSASMWHAYRYAVDLPAGVSLCGSLANIIKGLCGKNKKAIVCDLDNTLWGGVIGDDGAEHILIGDENPQARAFTALQQYLLGLSQMGIPLNVCTKNEPDIARTGFARPESILKTDDIVHFMAGWNPKPESIAQIAQQLNLLTESLVFLDDNPAEREIVRRQLPELAVPELAQPEEFVSLLARSGFFEPTSLSNDDLARTQMYQQNAQRTQAQAAFSSYEDYLSSLEMHCTLSPFVSQYFERITQLINKTNQFNPTTYRCMGFDVQQWSADPTCLTLCARLSDRFGDNGLVSALVGKQHESRLDILLWVMSCRVFKRNLESAMLAHLLHQCAQRGIQTITASYCPSTKNGYVRDLYNSLGFELTQQQADGTRSYCFYIGKTPPPSCTSMHITTQG